MNIVLFGGPGSGKGTQSEKLIEKYGLHHISTGEVLRNHIKQETELGKVAKKYIDDGQLIPDDLMIDILDDVLEKEAADKPGVIFDGFPRTIAQAEALNNLLKKRDKELNAVIGLEVPDDELVSRMINRGKLTGRADDNEETIKKRLKVYHDQTSPLKEHYKKQNKYVSIDGKREIDSIFDSIVGELDKHYNKH